MMKKMKGKKLLIMFKFYHVIKFKGGGDYQPKKKKKKKKKEKKRKEKKGKGGGCCLNQVHFGSGFGSGTGPVEMVLYVYFWIHVTI